MLSLPDAFLSRMQGLLGADYSAFLHAMTEEGPARAFRVNTVKLSVPAFAAHAPFPLAPIPYAPDGFYFDGDKIGHYPCHHAGMIYAQDPGAMAALCALPELRGGRVLDVCAAPGGKSAQLAAAVGPQGLLVSNEYVASRCRELSGNIERLGIPNAIVMNTDAPTLAALYPAYFDLTLVDAPCSGEGMFRKSAEARALWSEENVRRSAERQAEILCATAATVRPGGYLLYSTCTYAVEEDEEQVNDFLRAHPDFALCPVNEPLSRHTAPGIDLPGAVADLTLCRRFYPHIAPGEGQFFVLMRRAEDAGRPAAAPAFSDARAPLPRAERAAYAAAFAELFAPGRAPDMAAAVAVRGGCALLPDVPLPPRGVFAAGVAAGEVRKGVFFPHHQLFTTYGSAMRRKISLSDGDADTARYLHGDTLTLPTGENGYTAVLLYDTPMGGGKAVNGTLKNLYPKGLRRMQ